MTCRRIPAPEPDLRSPVPERPVVLFLCVHNAGRSVAGRVLLDHYAGGRVEVLSGGSEPADDSTRRSWPYWPNGASTPRTSTPSRSATRRHVRPTSSSPWGVATPAPSTPGPGSSDWALTDPAGLPIDEVRAIVDDIDRRVRTLLDELLTAHLGTPELHRSADQPVSRSAGQRGRPHPRTARRAGRRRPRWSSGHIRTMLWKGVISTPRLLMARCRYSSRSGSSAAADSVPLRGAGAQNRYSDRAPSRVTVHGMPCRAMVARAWSARRAHRPPSGRRPPSVSTSPRHGAGRRHRQGVAGQRAADAAHVDDVGVARRRPGRAPGRPRRPAGRRRRWGSHRRWPCPW